MYNVSDICFNSGRLNSNSTPPISTLKKGTINIGDRQRGRIKADSVIDCEPIKDSILVAIEKLYSKDFQNNLNNVANPYGSGGASSKIVKIIEDTRIEDILKKKFYDLT